MKHLIIAVIFFATVAALLACGAAEEAPAVDTTEYADIDAPDPYSDNGVWLVPEQVQPGRYRVTESTEPVTSLRWMQLCSDQYCDNPRGGGVGDMAYGSENRFIVIPADGSVKSYRNNGVRLESVPE